MKIRKILSAVTAAAIAMSVTTGMFSFGAGAYTGMSYTELKEPDAGATPFSTSWGSKHVATYQIRSDTNEFPSLISGSALDVAKDYDETDYTFELYDTTFVPPSGSFTGTVYSTKITSDFFDDVNSPLIYSTDFGGVNLALDFSKPKDGVLMIKGADTANYSLFGTTLSYNIGYQYAMKLLEKANVDTSDMLRYYVKDGDNEVTIALRKAAANITFDISSGNDIENEKYDTYHGLYIEAYSPAQGEYYTKEEAKALIKQTLVDTFGLTGVDADDTLTDVTDRIASEITAKYLNDAGIDTLIHDYFTKNSGANLSDLTELLIDNTDLEDRIVNEIFRIFGDGTTQYQANAIKDYVIKAAEDDIKEQIGTLLGSTAEQIAANTLGTLIDNLIDKKAQTINADVTELKQTVDDVKAQYPGKSLVEILTDLESGLSARPTETAVKQLIKDALTEAVGWEYTDLRDNNVQKYVDNAVNTIYSQLDNKADTATIETYVQQFLNDNLDDFVKDYMDNNNMFGDALKDAVTALFGGNSNYMTPNEYNDLLDRIFDIIVDKARLILANNDTRKSTVTGILRDYSEDWIKEYIASLNYVDEDTVEEMLEKALGTHTSEYQTYVDNMKESILDEVDGKLLSDAELNEKITDQVLKNLDFLVWTFINTTSGKNQLNSVLMDTFGGLSDTQRMVMADALWGDLTSELTEEVREIIEDTDELRSLISAIESNYNTTVIPDLVSLEAEIVRLSAEVDQTRSDVDDLLAELRSGALKGDDGKDGADGADGRDGKDGEDGKDGRDGRDGKDGKDGADGKDGKDGTNGQSFNEWAVQNYGSVDNFIAMIVNQAAARSAQNGTNSSNGASAYEIAVQNGFRGTQQEWLNSLVGDSAYEIAVRNGFRGSEADWLESLRGADGRDGRDGVDGRDGRDGKDGADGQLVYVNGYAPNSANNGIDLNDPDDYEDEEVYVVDDEKSNNGVAAASDDPYDQDIITRRNAANADAAAAAANNGNGRSANPATGAAAGIIIPAAAIGSVLLIKKDKRKRGRK